MLRSRYFAFMNVSILAVRAYLEVVSQRGVPREEFLTAARIDPDRLDDMHGRLELSELDRMQAAAIALTGDPALGLHMAENASAPAYDVMGHLPLHAATLRESLETLIRFGRILSDAAATLEERDDVATIAFKFVGAPDSPPVRLRAELAIAGFLRVLREFCGEGAMPREVLFEHGAPPYRAEYTRLFGGLERFAQPITALRFDGAMLSREPVHKNPRLKAILTSEAERILDRLDRPATVAERLREWLGARPVCDAPTMDDAAKQLGVSARSLRRHLTEQGVSYPQLLDEAHAAFAKRLLEDPNRSIYQVAFDTGFSDPSAFHRAFRRWTGMTPLQYRATPR